MGFMAIVTPSASESRDRIVFESKRTCLLRVTCHAFVFDVAGLFSGGVGGVNAVAVTAHQPPFRHRMMRALPELGDFCTMTTAAERRFIRLQEFAGYLRCWEDLLLDQPLISGTNDRRCVLRVNLVAGNAGHIGSCMRRRCPVRTIHEVCMAPQAGCRRLFGAHLGE